jgi:general secretion pathway protein H
MNPWPRLGRGFTLLELLVVVVLLAILSTAAVLSVGNLGEDRELEEESARLLRLLQLADEEAIMDGRDYGLYFEDSRYRFLRYRQETLDWQPVGDDVFRDRQLPEGLWLSLVVEDREVELKLPDDSKSIEPHIVILSSGEMTPFELSIGREFSERRSVIEGLPNGTIELTEIDPDDF